MAAPATKRFHPSSWRSTMDTVVQRCDGPRQLHDDDGDDELASTNVCYCVSVATWLVHRRRSTLPLCLSHRRTWQQAVSAVHSSSHHSHFRRSLRNRLSIMDPAFQLRISTWCRAAGPAAVACFTYSGLVHRTLTEVNWTPVLNENCKYPQCTNRTGLQRVDPVTDQIKCDFNNGWQTTTWLQLAEYVIK